MLFNSYIFLFLFLPISVLLTLAGAKYIGNKFGEWVLILASFFFYGYWDYRYVPLLIGSIVINFLLGHLQHKYFAHEKRKKLILFLGVVFNPRNYCLLQIF